MKVCGFELVYEKAGVISPDRCWVAYYGGYLYIHDTLPGLIWMMMTEWRDDRHLVG